MHHPGIEPRANAWKAFMLPLHQWCCCYLSRPLSTSYTHYIDHQHVNNHTPYNNTTTTRSPHIQNTYHYPKLANIYNHTARCTYSHWSSGWASIDTTSGKYNTLHHYPDTMSQVCHMQKQQHSFRDMLMILGTILALWYYLIAITVVPHSLQLIITL